MELKGASFRKRGFTLLELMIGVAVIAVIAAIAIPSFMKYVRDAREAELTQALLQAKRAQDIVIQTHGKAAVLFEGSGAYGDSDAFPKLDYRVSSQPKFNLIIGAQGVEPQVADDDPNAKFRFDQLYPNANLPSNPNRFGMTYRQSVLQPNEYLLGVEANFDSDPSKHVMAVNQAGLLYKLCDDFSNSVDMIAAAYYTSTGLGDIECNPTAAGGNDSDGDSD